MTMDAAFRRRPSPEAQLAGLGLFAQPEAPDLATLSPDERRTFERQRAIERLIPVARELAEKAGPLDRGRDVGGITVANLRKAAVVRGILTGTEKGRTLAYLHAVMPAAKLRNTGHYRRSDIEGAHGNLNAVWELSAEEVR